MYTTTEILNKNFNFSRLNQTRQIETTITWEQYIPFLVLSRNELRPTQLINIDIPKSSVFASKHVD